MSPLASAPLLFDRNIGSTNPLPCVAFRNTSAMEGSRFGQSTAPLLWDTSMQTSSHVISDSPLDSTQDSTARCPCPGLPAGEYHRATPIRDVGIGHNARIVQLLWSLVVDIETRKFEVDFLREELRRKWTLKSNLIYPEELGV